jgi:DNA-binding SARP family transcriptional activator
VALDGELVALGGAKQRAVLAVLLLHANEVVPLERLIDDLWEGRAPETAANVVQGYVSHLRKIIEPGRAKGEHTLLVSEPPGYALRLAPEALDAARFEGLAAAARDLMAAGNPHAARERLVDAFGLWRGPPFADLAYERFAAPEIARLEELRLTALEDRIDADLALGHEVVAELRELVAEHPLRERLRAQLMTALYRSGRQADALELYRDGHRVLGEQLGIEPGPALRELERSILRQDASLGRPRLAPLVPRRRRRWATTLAAVVLAAAAAAGVALTRGSTARAPVNVYPHSVAVVDPTRNAIVADILVGGYPGPIAADASWIYVCNIGSATLSRIDPTRLVEVDSGSFSRATDLVATGGGLWAADGGTPGHTPLGVGPGTLLHYLDGPRWQTLRLGPEIAPITEEQTTVASDGGDRVVWAGNEDSATLVEIDASLGRKLLTIRGLAPSGIAPVRSGNFDTVWVSDERHGVVARVDEREKRITARIHVAGGPTRIAADASQVWVVVRTPKPAIVRIDPVQQRVVARIPLSLVPSRIALAADAVWVSAFRWSNHLDEARDGEVLRIDPRTDRVVARIRLGDVAADGVLVAHGRVWVAVPPSA